MVGPSCPLSLRTQGTTIKSTNARDTQKPCGSPQGHKSVWALTEPPPCQALWQHTTYTHALASPTKSPFKVGLFNLTSHTRHQCGEVGSSGPKWAWEETSPDGLHQCLWISYQEPRFPYFPSGFCLCPRSLHKMTQERAELRLRECPGLQALKERACSLEPAGSLWLDQEPARAKVG